MSLDLRLGNAMAIRTTRFTVHGNPGRNTTPAGCRAGTFRDSALGRLVHASVHASPGTDARIMPSVRTLAADWCAIGADAAMKSTERLAIRCCATIVVGCWMLCFAMLCAAPSPVLPVSLRPVTHNAVLARLSPQLGTCSISACWSALLKLPLALNAVNAP